MSAHTMTERDPSDLSDLDDFDSELAADGVSQFFVEQSEKLAFCMPKGARHEPRNPRAYEPCRKCRGTGRFVGYTGRVLGPCHKCNGTGNGLSLAPAAVAARARVLARKLQAAERKAESVIAFRAAHPDIVAWWTNNRDRFEFAKTTERDLAVFGQLTDAQIRGIRKCLEADKARAAAADARAVDVSGEGFTKLLAAFVKAGAKLKYPALTFENVTFKPAKKYPGSLYVTGGRRFESAYYGKVSPEGRYSPSRDATPAIIEEVKRIGADPLGAAVAHGLKTGNCACCGRELTVEESVERGIGPVCYARFFA
jgi:hypothetical protein